MALGKQAKVLSAKQVMAMLRHIAEGRNAARNTVIFLLSVKAGLRAKEIASLTWNSVLNSEGQVGDELVVTNAQSKGHKGGREIFINKELRQALVRFLDGHIECWGTVDANESLVQSERGLQKGMSAQVIVNTFSRWYSDMGFVGASSHSGRRTFITNGARKIVECGGSLRDVQQLAGHSSLQTTQCYIEGSTEAKRRLMDII
ncbi:MAG: site-specific integrase [Amylibacter sp.]|nr:site-specific integrase [Amylibacter sp.]